MHKNTNALVKAIRLATLAAVAAPVTAFAGGFSLNEQSASAMGVANAGVAANPENATTVLFNPAGMSQLSGTNISFGAAVLDIDAEAKDGAIGINQVDKEVTGSTGGDIADPAVLPNFYLSHEINDSIDVGFGIHAPYGLAANYKDDFVGRFFADKTELTAISFTPSISVSNGQGLSMGAGINIIYAKGTLTKFQDNSGTNAQATGPVLAPEQGYADIQGDDIGATFRVGFLYEFNDRTQVGLTAQTGTTLNLTGDAEFTDIATITPPQTPQVGGGASVPFDSTEPVKVPLAIPESVTVGLKHKLSDTVTLLAGATYAKWSRFESLDVYGTDSSKPLTGKSPGGSPGLLTHIPEEWKDTWQLNVGGVWQVSRQWALKAGYAWDESPVDKYVTARIPSSDRHWLSLGAQWADEHSGWTVDAAVGTLLFTEDPKVSDQSYVLTSAGTQPNPVDPNSAYSGEYDLSAWSAGIQVSKAF
ncbi:aromatic hydrocarbon degradation membrane protein [Marinobacter santoriniensis NKSG1]|uniref:Aromatic hydrocarbon degradation membrane protein n=1 Tax=Marinobacter santoriniensis NKSG1 TaxID=1288826 RepID=M7CLT9_9GAMM|nr:outer membrane protein transport protein [Marinobacter santoriniensis]EMP54169.1 aromatic hydrocarbon degradation membrane protein [Marinobacter santoriniensis NKSG1]